MMVYLYEPDGTLHGEFAYQYAVDWCMRNPGWYWGLISGEA